MQDVGCSYMETKHKIRLPPINTPRERRLRWDGDPLEEENWTALDGKEHIIWLGARQKDRKAGYGLQFM